MSVKVVNHAGLLTKVILSLVQLIFIVEPSFEFCDKFLECFNKTFGLSSLHLFTGKQYCIRTFIFYNWDILKKEKDNSFFGLN